MSDAKCFISLILSLCLIASVGCKKPSVSISQSTPADTQALGPSFGTDQNDSEGYGGRPWASTDGLVSTVNSFNINMLPKVIGPPGEVNNGFFLESRQTEPVFKTFALTDNDKVSYGYFEGKLTFVLVHLDGSYQDTANDLTSKYDRAWNINAESFGNDTAPAKWGGYGFSGALYRRGKTNTRIYLMRSIDSNGDEREVNVLYIPSSYLKAIHDDWWNKYLDSQRRSNQQQQAAQDAVRQSDRQAIQ